jgi:thymidylate kinase
VASLARGVRPPDLTILVDLPIAVAAERRQRAGRPVERYDADSYLARVAENYRQLARETGATVIDGAGTLDEVGRAIAELADALPERND